MRRCINLPGAFPACSPEFSFIAKGLGRGGILDLQRGIRVPVCLPAARDGFGAADGIATALDPRNGSAEAAQYPALALVDGVGWPLALFGAALALAGVIYWTSYHAVYTAAGDVTRRGRQVAARQSLLAIASITGPALGGIMLTVFGPWVAFGTAAVIEIVAIVPLFGIAEPAFARVTPRGGYVAARNGFLLFVTDGWINNSAVMAWNLILFISLRDRFDAFGGAFAAAMLAGSIGGLILGRVIDMGHARRIAVASTAVLSATLLAKAFCGTDPAIVVTVAIGATLVGGLYMPALMTAFYNEAHAAPCSLRYQIAAEGGVGYWRNVGRPLRCRVVRRRRTASSCGSAGAANGGFAGLSAGCQLCQAQHCADRSARDDVSPHMPAGLPNRCSGKICSFAALQPIS